MSEAPDQAPPWTTQRIKDAIEDCEVGLKMHAPPDAILAAADLLALLRMIPEPAASPPAASPRKLTETVSPWEYLQDEMDARGMCLDDVSQEMGGNPILNRATLDFMQLEDKRLLLGRETAEQLARAFPGQNAETWLRLDEMWRTGITSPEPAAGSSTEKKETCRDEILRKAKPGDAVPRSLG